MAIYQAGVALNKSHVGLGNVTNESKATMFTSPAFTGTPTGINEVVAAQNPPYQNLNSGTAWYTLDTIDIPSSGYWQIWAQLRWGWHQRASWSKVGLHFLNNTSSSTDTMRMTLENAGQHQANANATYHYEWILHFFANTTFPQTVTLKLYSNTGSTSWFLQNDGNGWNALGACKLKPSDHPAVGAQWIAY